jgi:hypothetical protein
VSLYIYCGLLLDAVGLAVLFNKVSQFIFMIRRNIGKMNTNAGWSQAVSRPEPYNTGMNGYGHRIAGQPKIQRKNGLNRQGLSGLNKGTAGAQVDYAGIWLEA